MKSQNICLYVNNTYIQTSAFEGNAPKMGKCKYCFFDPSLRSTKNNKIDKITKNKQPIINQLTNQ